MNQNDSCEACGETSVITLQQSFLCGRCLWAVSLLLRNRMQPQPVVYPGERPDGHDLEAVRQAIDDVQNLRRRLVELGNDQLAMRSA